MEYLLLDYRDLPGGAKFGEDDGAGGRRWDRAVSVGMFEHVGRKNYGIFLKTVRRSLKPDGLFLLHCIGSNGGGCGADPWLTRYIFPNGALPSASALTRALEGVFVMEDWHNFGAYYDSTLMAWHARFRRGCEEGAFACDERLRRMYDYYLLSCAGAFRSRCIQLWQLALSPEGVPAVMTAAGIAQGAVSRWREDKSSCPLPCGRVDGHRILFFIQNGGFKFRQRFGRIEMFPCEFKGIPAHFFQFHARA